MALPRNLVKTHHIGLVFRALDPRPVRARHSLRSVRRFTTGREGRRPLDDRYESSSVPWAVTVGSGSSLARMR
jgi:hypothetical protein